MVITGLLGLQLTYEKGLVDPKFLIKATRISLGEYEIGDVGRIFLNTNGIVQSVASL